MLSALSFTVVAALALSRPEPLPLALAPLQAGPAPTFVALDPASVEASLGDVEPCGKSLDASLVSVRVVVPAGHDGGVEPLAFRVTTEGKAGTSVLVRRVDAPSFGRCGRAARPRVPCEYPVLVPLAAKALRGARVEVVELSAWTGDAPTAMGDEPPVRVLAPVVSNDFDSERGQSLPRTTVAVENPLEHDVDVILRAQFVNPRAATTLVRGRALAKRTTDLVFAGLPTGAGEYVGAEIRRVEVVDWSVLVADGAELAAELLGEAFRRWDAVPDTELPITARFRLTHRGGRGTVDVTGEAEFGVGGAVTVRLEGEASQSAVSLANAALRDAAVHVSRRAPSALGEGTHLDTLGPPVVVRLPRHPLPDDLALPRLVELAGGAVRGVMLEDEDRVGLREDWRVIEDGDRWRLAGRRTQTATLPREAAIDERVEWLRVGERWLPARVTRVLPEWSPGIGFAASLEFQSWRRGATTLRGALPPSGPLADELRAAWDAFYRHPSPDVRVTCQFEATSPGTDAVWLGRKRVKGAFDLAGLHGAAWGTARASIDDEKATADERERLGYAALDRLQVWANRDLCREPRFEDAFRGATLARDGDWIVVDGARFTGVLLRDGQVAALRGTDGDEVQLRWRSVEGALVPVERTRGEERVALTWTALSDGWRWPTRCELVDVFVDAGTEVLECSRVRVAPLDR